LDANKGDLLLIVADNVADELITEIEQLENELYRDGWMVTTITADPAGTAIDLKEEIVDLYASLPNLRSVYLLGNVPVPHAGELGPDAHTNHVGAWSADVFYGDMDGIWTDTDVNNTTSANARNHNVPGDGNLDQSRVPSEVELQVGRVDLSDLPVYEETEIELLRMYLTKAHEFKTTTYVPQERGLIDQGSFTGLAEGFAQNGYRNFTAFFGPDAVNQVDYWTTLNAEGEDYLWSYGCGSGSYTSVGGLDAGTSLTSAELSDGFNNSTFTMLFGSYFGDYDITNNLMRTAIANGRTLSCSWAARPNWHYHNMAMGENIGYSTKISQDPDSDYISLTLGTGDSFITGEGVHVAQLGDPSLRLYYVTSPGDVTVVNDDKSAILSWVASADGAIDGYNVYRRTEGELWVKVNTEIITETEFTDATVAGPGDYEYLVKSVKLKTNGSGTFYNESLGQIGTTSFFASAESFDSFEFALYPNPTKGEFSIQTNEIVERINVTGLDGKVVYSAYLQSNTIDMNLTNLESGVYFVTLVSGEQYSTKRLVIE